MTDNNNNNNNNMNNDDDDMLIDLDLNQHPPPPFGSYTTTTHSRIEDRLRQLEAVSARFRQRQRWRQARNNPELSYTNTIDSQNPNSKRDITHVAKALSMDVDSNNTDNHNNINKDEEEDASGGGFFDCNICLEMARDPVLTCCGHLFCWCCFYQLAYVDSTAKECPVCKGEVTDSSVTPIYGNGRSRPVLKLESGVEVPPRPQARRVESVRQQRVVRGVSSIPVAEALRRIRNGIGSVGENNLSGAETGIDPSLSPFRRRHRHHRFLRRNNAQLIPDNIIDVEPEPQNAEMS
ncbi:uncharacterized protein LOC143613950 [Bidens hawaiensis]|uniref:uncharacterized protein LOC143613950 n=1 Tax=Bidens hawaiensis TaxID=980011 RepID=UPI00404B4939